MILEVTFEEQSASFDMQFGEINNVSDGGYERGYAEGSTDGYTKGHTDGVSEGYADGYSKGLAERTYEAWTITYVDGTVEEKEVALL